MIKKLLPYGIIVGLQLGFFLFSSSVYPDVPNHPVLFLSSVFISLIGALILFLNYKKEQFVGRFMIATTFQMMAMLAIILALSYKKIPDALLNAMLLLGYFLILLIVQSIALVKWVQAEEKQ